MTGRNVSAARFSLRPFSTRPGSRSAPAEKNTTGPVSITNRATTTPIRRSTQRVRRVFTNSSKSDSILTVSGASRSSSDRRRLPSSSRITPSTVGRLALSVITFSSNTARQPPRRPTSDPKNLRNLVSKCPRSIFVTDIQMLTTRGVSSAAAAAATTAFSLEAASRPVGDDALDATMTAVLGGFAYSITSAVNTTTATTDLA